MKTELLSKGYAPVPHTLSDGTVCVGVFLPVSRHITIVDDLVSSLIVPGVNVTEHRSLPYGKDLLLFWPKVIY